MTDIHKVGHRQKLAARRESYWRHVEGSGYIGYRKMPKTGSETWLARWYSDDKKREYCSLGNLIAD